MDPDTDRPTDSILETVDHDHSSQLLDMYEYYFRVYRNFLLVDAKLPRASLSK